MVQKCSLLYLIKQNCLLKFFLKTPILMAWVYTSLPVFPSRTNLKLHNISVTHKMVKKVITNLDSSKVSIPDCTPVVVLKNCESELSYILSYISLVVAVFKNVVERSTAKIYYPVSFLSVVSKVFEKLVNNAIFDYLEKCGLFSNFLFSDFQPLDDLHFS